ncbi:CPBP family intramembrane glutamic endopeptidase [Carboxylicivirga marina]|uniref:CPBP family intramembrane metalloprotease n=1 Tax=Carboxylicivirga marina TaxID=2800988 RepID=A0ABS1HLV4_9BACT|nr:type II CAAX endopeptidase family protein [Carboxylicivirga marina]MBK3518673.1 CPBP family intramembrane metalloprotease [Carboxylicivirga marina]
MNQGSLSNLTPIAKLVVLFTSILFCVSISTLVMSLIAKPIFDVDMTSMEELQSNITFMQSFQIIQSISLFIIPSLLAFYFFFKNFNIGIKGEGTISIQTAIITISLIFIAQAFITYSGWLNHQLQFPESMQYIMDWMSKKENETAELTKTLIRSDNWFQIFITVLMMSILPAIGEEWLFRGLLQRYLGDWINNKHIAIFLTAIIFSAVHMQFLTFLPRFLLGIILGYIFIFSGNLWLAIIAHFTNNFMAIIAYIVMSNNEEHSPLDIPSENPFGFGVVISLLVIIGGLYAIKHISLQTPSKTNAY